mmetsp:Transcript_5890/g.12796  ORF Transcript_5890/g.12796 Transcript_5890/m.12796 type:complete len:350 (-) Transcript_5890:1938-2987(-)
MDLHGPSLGDYGVLEMNGQVLVRMRPEFLHGIGDGFSGKDLFLQFDKRDPAVVGLLQNLVRRIWVGLLVDKPGLQWLQQFVVTFGWFFGLGLGLVLLGGAPKFVFQIVRVVGVSEPIRVEFTEINRWKVAKEFGPGQPKEPRVVIDRAELVSDLWVFLPSRPVGHEFSGLEPPTLSPRISHQQEIDSGSSNVVFAIDDAVGVVVDNPVRGFSIRPTIRSGSYQVVGFVPGHDLVKELVGRDLEQCLFVTATTAHPGPGYLPQRLVRIVRRICVLRPFFAARVESGATGILVGGRILLDHVLVSAPSQHRPGIPAIPSNELVVSSAMNSYGLFEIGHPQFSVRRRLGSQQ